VIAVGNAYGYEHTVTRGIISALHRTVPVSDTQSYRDLIQTDASINPGNSGGPLLNIDGEMIGINVAVRAGAQGIGFAIPVDAALDVAGQLLSVERIDQTYHGLTARSTQVLTQRELVVSELDDESPAARCGLQEGDVVVEVAGSAVHRQLDVERRLLGRRPGEEVELKVRRQGQPVKVSLVLASLPRGRSQLDRAWDVIGLKLTPIAADQLPAGQSRYRGGLRVTSVRTDSPAAQQGIQRGDILVGMHVWETVSLDNVAYILNRPDFAKIEPLKFYIVRGDETLYGHLTVSARQ
jgi:serine protease Do